LSGNTLTFSEANWDTPEQFTVTAQDDSFREGTHYARITTTITSTDIDAFLGVTADNVAEGIANKVNGNVDSPYHASSAANVVTITGPAFRYDMGTPYTSVTVALGGAAAENETWALIINGKLWTYTAGPTDTVATIAQNLE